MAVSEIDGLEVKKELSSRVDSRRGMIYVHEDRVKIREGELFGGKETAKKPERFDEDESPAETVTGVEGRRQETSL